jgi:pimeloyl-ACP methyl ester carboxylesterase
MKKLLIIVVVLLVVLVVAGAMMAYFHPIAVLSAMKRRQLVKSGFTKSTIDSAVGAQTIFSAGSGPTIIFIHGAGDNAGTWNEVAPKFADKYHVVVIDLAGHGESAPAHGSLEFETMLSGFGAVVSKQFAPVTLVGNSLGAWVAMLFASQHPDLIARVVAIDGGPLRGDRVDLAKLPENREEARKIWDAILDPGSPRIPDFILDDVVRESHTGAIGRMNRSDMETHLATEESLHRFPVPVDVIWGKADRLVPTEYADRMIAALQLPEIRPVVIARCGHIPQQECPIRFSQELAGILTLQRSPRPAAPVKDAAVKEK